MSRLVLIPVRGRDRVEDVFPYLGDVAQPGTKIIFLVHLGTRQFEQQLEKLLAVQREAKQSGQLPTPAPVNGAHGDPLRQIAGRLQGVEIALTFYTGSWRSLVDQSAKEEMPPIVLLRPTVNRLVRWFRKVFHAGLPRSLAAAPILLCHWVAR